MSRDKSGRRRVETVACVPFADNSAHLTGTFEPLFWNDFVGGITL